MILRAKINKKTLNTHIPYLYSLILTLCSIIPQRSSALVFLFSFCVSMVLQRPCIRSLLVFFSWTQHTLCVSCTRSSVCACHFFFLAQAQYTLCVSCHVHAQACVCVCHTCNVSLLLVFFYLFFKLHEHACEGLEVNWRWRSLECLFASAMLNRQSLGTYF
jgi:hypothetical protein